VLGSRYLGDAGLRPAPAPSPMAADLLRRRAYVWGLLGMALVLIFAVGAYTEALPITAKQIADAAGYLLFALTVVFFAWLFFAGKWTPFERKRLLAIGILFVASALFWSEFEQAGSTLNLFADRATRTSLLGWSFPSGYFQSLQPMFIIVFAPVFAWMWIRLGRREPSSPTKFGIGLVFVGAGFAVLAVASSL